MKEKKRMYGRSMGGVEKRLETGRGKRYDLSVVKDNKV